jgi:hypothetical protein
MGYWEDKRRQDAMDKVDAFRRMALVSPLEDDDSIHLGNKSITDDDRDKWARKITKTRTGERTLTLVEVLNLKRSSILKRLAEAFPREHKNAKVRLHLIPYAVGEFKTSTGETTLFLYNVSVPLNHGEDPDGRPIPRSETLTFAGDSGSLLYIRVERSRGKFANYWASLARSIPLCSDRPEALNSDDLDLRDPELLNVKWLLALEPMHTEKKVVYRVDFGIQPSTIAHETGLGPSGIPCEFI